LVGHRQQGEFAMKRKIFCLTFLSFILSAQSGDLVINPDTGQNITPLDQIRKIQFTIQETHALVITENDGSYTKYKLQDIDRIQFIQSSVSVNSSPVKGVSFNLFQNFPNPFNPSTKIRYVISQSGWVDLKVFNIAGQRVKQLVSAYLIPGAYEIGWTGTDIHNQAVPNGIYFCLIRQNQQTMTIKMLLKR
jgi:hypothetical protein